MSPVRPLSLGRWSAALAVAALTACGAPETPSEEGGQDVAAVAAPRPLEGSLAWAVAGEWRTAAERAHDEVRQPIETIEFFRIAPSDVIIDAWPGDGWYTAILAPYLAAGGGAYIAAHPAPTSIDGRVTDTEQHYFERFGDARQFGQVRQGQLGPNTAAIAPEASADAAIAIDVFHAWMAYGLAEKALADIHGALRPGGYLGVVEARAPDESVQDPSAANGYVQENYVLRLAEEAGFELEEASALHANPHDTADHPFGVWTLAPYRRSSPLGQPADPSFDRAAYDAIGAPDRMTLLFRKPRI